MTTPRKIGVLVAIPIKGRKLMNRSGGKQSPYVQLKLSDQKKRTKASLIAAAEPEWDQEASQLDMNVSVYDEGKKNEIIGEGVLLLHEVVDKGELDVWFPIKYNGSSAGDIYFELTFYAAAPPPVAGGTPPTPQAQIHPPIRHTQPGYQGGPGIHPLPHTSPVSSFGSPAVGPPASFPAYNATPRPFSTQPFPAATPPFGAPPVSGPGFNQPYGGVPAFRPPGGSPYTTNMSPQFGNPGAPGGYPNMPQAFPGGNNNNNGMPPRFPVPHHSSPGGQHPAPSFPQGPGGPPNSFPNNGPSSNYPNNGPSHNYPNNNNHHNNNHHNNNSGPNNFNNFNSGPNNNFNNNGPNNNFNRNNSNFNNGPNNSNFNNGPNNNNFNNNNNNNNSNNQTGPGGAPVTPLMQYNYSLGGSFP
ncbi:hypothetical protein BGX27_003578 [Mortierella sp. AM989]|nr:hypothetical protein BGX27_003578 [Mortierella sp. AM989]